MAIYGIGAFYDGTTDVSMDFLREGVACIGWDSADAPALHSLLRHVEVGDLVYIKAHPPGRQLTIKAVGIVTDEEPRPVPHLGTGVSVRWVWRGPSYDIQEGREERYNVRSNTLYEEHSPSVQQEVLQLLFSQLR